MPWCVQSDPGSQGHQSTANINGVHSLDEFRQHKQAQALFAGRGVTLAQKAA